MNRVCLCVLVACGLCAAGCQRMDPKTAAGLRTYTLVGEVRAVNRDQGLVTIRHEAIPGFMGAMTMPFTLKKKELLDDVQPGDEVEGPLRVLFEGTVVKDYELTDLVVTRPATGPALSMHLSGGTASLSPVPSVLKPGDVVPDFSMTDQDGRTVRLADLRGKVVVLTFIYTRCPLPDFCPRIDRKFAELANRLSIAPARAERVRLLSVSFDPEHDTPEVLRRHAQQLGARTPLWTFAVATHDELFKVAGSLGLTYGPSKDEIIHNLSTAVIDPEGRLARLDAGAAGKDWLPADLLKTIGTLLPR